MPNDNKQQANGNKDLNSGKQIDKDLVSGTDAQRLGRDNTSNYDDSLRPGQAGYDADRDSRVTGFSSRNTAIDGASTGGTNQNR